MKKIILVLAALGLAGSASAYENAGGVLVAHFAGVTEANSNGAAACLLGTELATCELAVVRIDGATPTNTAYFKVYCAFPSTSSPRLMGVTWGISASTPKLVAGGPCGDFELPDAGWPVGPHYPLGNSVTWNTVQRSTLVPMYWFRGYGGGAYAGTVDFGPNPSQGGKFGNDNILSQLDDIWAYGKMGFDADGLGGCLYPPPPGACCAHDGTCTVTPPADCTGSWAIGLGCLPNPCPQPTGSCCMLDGSCFVTSQAGCAAGVWTMDGNCSPNACPQPTGACCHPDGSCSVTSQAACAAGVWTLDGTCWATICPPPITGACCRPDGSCFVTLQTDCAAGVWTVGGNCSPNICPQPNGACCAYDGTCTIGPRAACTGIWYSGSDCATFQCPPVGSCCHHDGTCYIFTQADCAAGVWTLGGNCSPNICPRPTGACCRHSTGVCEILTQAACAAKPYPEHWVWMGMDTICDGLCNTTPAQQESWGRIKQRYR